MSNSYLITGIILIVAGIAMTTLRVSGSGTILGRLMIFFGSVIVVAWMATALYPDLLR
ncbi:MAG TPA: hypothetical protein VHW90_03860 [Stellaceae bacterium]|jgi:hypothetical protein|nr:hypothetical protein [Stellaceae bacterium]